MADQNFFFFFGQFHDLTHLNQTISGNFVFLYEKKKYVTTTERFVLYAFAKLLTSGSIKDGGFGHEFHSLRLQAGTNLRTLG